ncbi:protein-methionine-sulfoxide reductase catalytic subunit MsrP [Aliiroseovarius sp. KMU-50]|uniref:Protein-methionine-sulfoxide reductase catalytic subunit MsrP n=1 Tax=Aliiroseovarius salicola TaxID=3009082 RepID=A0ABT4VWP3_9RHOB|nr:protein-methionine-sulfoxide reductase catalytic subunit MsrP [Aliiroseovarius sp. KMU-50]MDA5092686.1 protein-methionine-sulfoxide reductase catalytic subunit MsrP [Aliiroseovarius sp. KMU-50]
MAYRSKLKYSDVTPKADFLNRRQLMGGAGALAIGSAAGVLPKWAEAAGKYSTDATPNTFEEISTYNNFYEFGTGKGDPVANAQRLTTDPWSVQIDGMVDRPGNYDLADILAKVSIEERIYRFRCVEAWSMVVPWNGFELKQLLDMAGVQSGAKYVAFETLVRPEEMPGLRRSGIEWPYREGLRLDEALHPLTLMATGLYGKELPKQNGAPLRLVVPWKYGFKSIKSIVRVTLTDKMPPTTWNMLQSREYGFYSNVNPNVSHPRWSQATERQIGGGLFAKRKPTLMFNGYEKEVASLYDGMDLKANY